MCGRAMLTVSADDLEETFGYPAPRGYRPRYNIAPSQTLLAVSEGREGRGVREYAWGLVPFWAKDVEIGRRMINARAETVAEKPAFRKSFAQRRCLVIVDGFYEWKAEPGRRKRPYRIGREGWRPFTLGGIWERWEREGVTLETCAIVTTKANALMATIHDRMPVIVAPEHRDAWLEPDSGPESIDELLVPYVGLDLEAYEVSTKVNSPANDGPECIERVEPYPPLI